MNDEERMMNDEERMMNDEERMMNDEERMMNDEKREKLNFLLRKKTFIVCNLQLIHIFAPNKNN